MAGMLIGVVIAGAMAGCGKKEEKALPEKVVHVRTRSVSTEPLRPFVEAIGSLRPYEEVVISSEIEGILRKIFVSEGDRVTRGSLLAEVNETDFVLGVRHAQAALHQAEATLANVKQEYERKAALYREQLVTSQQFDDIAARREVSESDVERARASLALAREKLARTKIYSPLSGAVKEKRVSAGDFVRSGTFLVSLIRTDPLKLQFTVIEKDVGKLRKGQEVQFRVDAFPERLFRGRLQSIYANLEEKTRSLQVEALVENSQNSLKPGLFARVVLYTGAPADRIVVPINALLYEASTIKVFVIENGRAVEKIVKIGQKFGEDMEIVEGLHGGEQLVVVGQNNLAKGVKVHVAR
jgi:membrane fusion protein (multidrug efflux system)